MVGNDERIVCFFRATVSEHQLVRQKPSCDGNGDGVDFCSDLSGRVTEKQKCSVRDRVQGIVKKDCESDESYEGNRDSRRVERERLWRAKEVMQRSEPPTFAASRNLRCRSDWDRATRRRSLPPTAWIVWNWVRGSGSFRDEKWSED